MTDAGESAPSLTRKLLLWLSIQLIALGIGAAGAQLSAKAIRPPEALALHVMLSVQIASAAILWPWLFGEWRGSVAVIATALPCTQAAGFLSAAPPGRLIECGALLLLWLASLSILPTRRIPPLATTFLRATFIVISVGGVLSHYLHAEFVGPQSPTASAGPLDGALRELSGGAGLFPWICGGVLLIVSVLARLVMDRAGRSAPQA